MNRSRRTVSQVSADIEAAKRGLAAAKERGDFDRADRIAENINALRDELRAIPSDHTAGEIATGVQ